MNIDELSKLVDSKTSGAFDTNDMAVMLPELEKLKKGDNYVEIGVDRGKSFAFAWYATKGVNCYGIDINNTPEREKMFKKEKMKTFYHDSSENIANRWKKKVNLLFIDGDHTYEAVLLDCQKWYPHMAKGGVMLFHDHVAGSGVMRAVSEWTYDKALKYEFPIRIGDYLSHSSIAKVTL